MLILTRKRSEKIVIDPLALARQSAVQAIGQVRKHLETGGSLDDFEPTITASPITVVVAEIHGDKAKLGIEADKIVPVHRKEVYDLIQKNGNGHNGGNEPKAG